MNMTTLAIDYTDNKNKHKFHIPISALKKPTNAKEYTKIEEMLDNLVDEVRDDENHPLAIVIQIIGENLEQYDNEHHPPIGHNINEVEMVKHLMKAHHLYQKDLADIFGSQANVSKFLNGERTLSKNQIIKLKNKFGISADFFVK